VYDRSGDGGCVFCAIVEHSDDAIEFAVRGGERFLVPDGATASRTADLGPTTMERLARMMSPSMVAHTGRRL
jgi:hypothetical protein